MSTRYVWRKTTYSNPQLETNYYTTNAHLGISSTDIEVVLCSYYSVGLIVGFP